MNDFKDAVRHFQANRLPEAASICTAILKATPGHHPALNLLGAVEIRSGNLAAARDYFGRALTLVPGDADYRDNFISTTAHCADAVLLRGDYEEALPLYQSLAAAEVDSKRKAAVDERVQNVAMVIGLRKIKDQFQGVAPLAPPVDLVTSIRAQLRPDESAAGTIILFHVQKFDARLREQLEDRTSRQIDLREVLGIAVKAARLTNPTYRIVILTDTRSEMDGFDFGDAQVIRLPLSGERLIYEKTLSYYAVALSGQLTGPIVYIDTDICVNRSFGEIDFSKFDVALTYRLEPHLLEMPVNEGVILASSAEMAARFFGLCLQIYTYVCAAPPVKERYNFDIGMWWGPQLSIAAFCDWRLPPARPEIDVIQGLRCRFLPCEQYNFTPDEIPDRQKLGDKWIVHFKGARKHWMPGYLAQYEGSLSRPA